MRKKVYPYFDEKALMVMTHTGSAQATYHTRLYDREVHSISLSSAYAADRIICDKNYELGEKIFDKVIDLQDSRKESKTYGLWPWMAEETLEEMEAPDYNMADFNAKEMIVSIYESGQHISEQMREKMLLSISRACECIMRRNVSVGYTNVCITDCFVTLAAAELIGDARFLEYGRKKLKKFLYYTKGKGEISEYNSPTYSILTVKDIGDILTYIKDEEILKTAEEINNMLWKMLAEHFDYKILQLAGPQARAYTDFVNAEFLKTVSKACQIDFSSHPMFHKILKEDEITEYHSISRGNPKCPEWLMPYFKGEKIFSYVRKFLSDGINYPYFDFPKTAITYRGTDYVIGTYNKCEMWNQTRPFLGYIHGEKPISFRFKCYHDGFDFSSGAYHCVQHESDILGSLNFSENRGDTHIDLDMISNGMISAEDLRVTFEFCGDTQNIAYQKDGDILNLNVNGRKIRICTFLREFGENVVKESIDVSDNRFQYSLIFYHGERKMLDLCALEKAMVAFTVEMEPKKAYTQPQYLHEGEFTNISWKPNERKLGMIVPNRTLKFIRNMSEDKQLLDDKDILEEIYRFCMLDM